MGERADRELVELARRGEESAIGELFSRYWRAARAAAFGVTGEFASAEDAAAEAFGQALAGMDSLRDPDRFGPWLRTIVVRKARQEIQSRHTTVDVLADELPDPNERPDATLERLELGALIQHAVRGLPDRLREAMALVYFEGYDAEAAAVFLNIPGGTLRRRLHDGRRRLRSAVEQILLGSTRMNEEREHLIQRLKRLIDDGEIYEALRGSLALSPPPSELIGLIRRKLALASDSPVSPDMAFIREAASRFLGPSHRALDPNHPVGAVAAAIRKALPDFQEWRLDAGEAAARFLALQGEHRDVLRATLPPGFSEGRPGAFLRATRALVHVGGGETVRGMYQLLQDCPDEAAFRAAARGIRISDVLDLTWMAAGLIELRSVQEVLERVAFAVPPGEQVRFSTYDEPRYRSALQLQVGGVPVRFAYGGVLAEWPGRPQGIDAAHIRIFLEPWAAVQTGQVVDLENFPEMPPTETR